MKVTVVGLGKVGSSLAFGLLVHFKSRIERLVLWDIAQERGKSEARDLKEACYFLKIDPRVVQFRDRSHSDYLIICAGYPRSKKLESDSVLFAYNHPLLEEIRQDFSANKVFIVTNPPPELSTYYPNSTPIGGWLDFVRAKYGYYNSFHILLGKGYTNWGICGEVIRRIEEDL